MKRRVCGRALASKSLTPRLERPAAEWRSSAGSLLNTSPEPGHLRSAPTTNHSKRTNSTRRKWFHARYALTTSKVPCGPRCPVAQQSREPLVAVGFQAPNKNKAFAKASSCYFFYSV
jgi:hypothetical protein